MKIEETIMIEDLMEYAKRNDYFNLTTREFAELDSKVSKALEKQIPKEVISHNGLNETRCPKCDSVFGYSLELDEYTGEKFDYCYGCGQALKWGE